MKRHRPLTALERPTGIKNRLIHGTDGKWYDADCISPGVEVQRHIIDGNVVWKPITALEKRYNKAKLDFDRAADAVADALQRLDAGRKRRAKARAILRQIGRQIEKGKL